MHLQTQALPAIEPLDQDRERFLRGPCWTHQVSASRREQLANRSPIMQPAANNRLRFRAIHDFPALSDRRAQRKFSPERSMQSISTPDALLINWMKPEQFAHGEETRVFCEKVPGGLHLTTGIVSMLSH